MRVGLRITVATARGAVRAVPRIVEILVRHGATATFYFNLGPDRLHRLLPARAVAARAANAIQSARDAGCEVGLYGWDAVRWPHRVAPDDARWVEAALARACETFERVVGEPPRTHAAPEWHTSRHALRLTQRFGFEFASDTRGIAPFMPVCEGELVLCPQLPTTLPALDDLMGQAHVAHERVLEASAAAGEAGGDVFTLRAETAGGALAAAFERLLEGWRARGTEVVALRSVLESLEPARLPRHVVAWSTLPGRSRTFALQGAPFLA
jgi:peptidoglycan/xylan/chitin deacetylase (PgdA/CDA1 family)